MPPLQAVEFLKGVLSVYDLGCRWMFTCGQQAYADWVQISNNNIERRRIQDGVVRYGRHCRRVRERFEVGISVILKYCGRDTPKLFVALVPTNLAALSKLEKQAACGMVRTSCTQLSHGTKGYQHISLCAC